MWRHHTAAERQRKLWMYLMESPLIAQRLNKWKMTTQTAAFSLQTKRSRVHRRDSTAQEPSSPEVKGNKDIQRMCGESPLCRKTCSRSKRHQTTTACVYSTRPRMATMKTTGQTSISFHFLFEAGFKIRLQKGVFSPCPAGIRTQVKHWQHGQRGQRGGKKGDRAQSLYSTQVCCALLPDSEAWKCSLEQSRRA